MNIVVVECPMMVVTEAQTIPNCVELDIICRCHWKYVRAADKTQVQSAHSTALVVSSNDFARKLGASYQPSGTSSNTNRSLWVAMISRKTSSVNRML